jgi:hypothetical protein
MSVLRKCKINLPYEEPREALFHQWGTKEVYGDGENSFPVTFGIVECRNGEVKYVAPDQITFIPD